MIRQATGEALTPAVYFDDASGVPVTGLTPSALAWRKSDGAAVTPPVVAEVGGGFYRLTWAAAPTVDVLVRVDGGSALAAARYVPLELVVGGTWDRLDAAVSTRAAGSAVQAVTDAVAALGTPSQGSALTALSATVAGLGTPAQASALTSAVASLLAALAPLDVAVSTRATPDDLVCPDPIPALGGTLA